MLNPVKLLKLLSDTNRLRILMLIARKELCVCQIMGVLGLSQPLISRNLSLLNRSGVITERKEGKLVFYSLNGKMPGAYRKIVGLLKEIAEADATFSQDIGSLAECEEFQKKTGKCDMKTFREFLERKPGRTGRDIGRRDR